MTQEELDALMNGEISLEGIGDIDEEPTVEAEASEGGGMDDYRVNAQTFWPPPPPSREHQVVNQLDDVTRESEEKASAIFDILDIVLAESSDSENALKKALKGIKETEAVFQTLIQKFPTIQTFGQQLAVLTEAKAQIDIAIGKQQNIADQALNAMDIMQFQDIHRQKIERVINVMRALINYMNKLFESHVEDDKRVSSATHITGDQHNILADEDDIEALIAAFSKK